MVHVGEAAYFRKVYGDAFSHDVVLMEGVNSPITRRLTRSYRWIGASKSLGLVLQPRAPERGTVHAKIVHSDLSPEEFREAWTKVPRRIRWFIALLSPVIGLRLRFGSREAIARRLTLDDQPTQEEALSWSPEAAALNGAILDARDIRLLEHLEGILDQPATQVRSVAVVYGAEHVRALLHALTGRRGYFAEKTEWLTVFGV